jgi:hypothetical protein
MGEQKAEQTRLQQRAEDVAQLVFYACLGHCPSGDHLAFADEVFKRVRDKISERNAEKAKRS